MNKCPKCGKVLQAGATFCTCGWKADAGNEDPTAQIKDIVAQANTKAEEFKLQADALTAKNEELETKIVTLEEASTKTVSDIVELQGNIERVRVNMPDLQVFPGIPPTTRAGLDNQDRALMRDWVVHGLSYQYNKKHDSLTAEAETGHTEWAKKAAPMFQQQFATSDLFTSNAVPTGSMGAEQTGKGTEWMPTVMSQTIIGLMSYVSVILREADRVPLSVTKVSFPAGDFSSIAASCPLAELEPMGDAQPLVTSVVDMVAKRGACGLVFARRFLENAAIFGYPIVDYIIDKVVAAYGSLIDNQAINGVVATPHLLNGLIVAAAGVTVWNCQATHDTWAELDYYDFTQAKYAIAKENREGGKTYVGNVGRGILANLSTTTGQPILHEASAGITTLDGYPVVELAKLPDTAGDGECFALWGDLKKGFMLGILEDINIRESKEVYWLRDAVIYDVAMYLDMAIKNTGYFRRCDMNTAQAEGDE